MARIGKSFSIDTSQFDRVVGDIVSLQEKADSAIVKRVDLLTNLAYRIAHQKRPMMAPTLKKNARNKRDFRMRGGKVYRVSDPSAKLGVPVQTGALQASIKKEITNKSHSSRGQVGTSLFYAKFIEFGTSRMRARPFIRPAFMAVQEAARALRKQSIFHA